MLCLSHKPVRSYTSKVIRRGNGAGYTAQALLPERLPRTTQLLANYPNPFNPETWIPFELADDAVVTVTIYDVQGQRVRQLQMGLVTAGRYVTAD